jgi:ATP-dependent protease Clp ATPase subunit
VRSGALPPIPRRGLHSIMETILLDTMFDLPSLEGVD